MRLFLLSIMLGMALQNICAQDARALELISKTNKIVSNNTSYQYNYTYEGWGKTAGRFEGSVVISKQRGMEVIVHLNTLNESGHVVREEVIYTNGMQMKLLDKTEGILKLGTGGGGSGYLMSYALYAVFREFLMPNPFGTTIKDPSLSLEGMINVNGVDCHIISTNNPWGDRNHWYIGQEDFQVYGQKQENNMAATEGGFEFKMSAVKYNTALPDDAFQIPADHAKVVNEDERKIAVGEPAPEWLLQNAAGQKISSNQLRGKKVILDFWASWCAPCWKIMPVIDKLKADYKDENLAVYGVNVWESPKIEVASYLKAKGLDHYDVLFDQDAAVAKSFKIAALPLVVVIDEAGRIIYHNSGQDPDMDGKIRELLKQ